MPDLICINEHFLIDLAGFYLGFFVWGGVDPEKKFLSQAAARKTFFGLSRGMLPQKNFFWAF